MNNKIKALVLSLAVTTAFSALMPMTAKADSLSDTQSLLNRALSSKTFYDYNMAWHSIDAIQDTNVKNPLLWKLASIASVVYTPTVVKFTDDLNKLCQTGDGALYDQIVAEVGNSNLCAMDKGYLLGELTGWGKKLVYTPDYVTAVDAVVNAWNALPDGLKIDAAINTADSAINGVQNQYSKSYLQSQIQQVKDKHNGVTPSKPLPSNLIFDKTDTDKFPDNQVELDRLRERGFDDRYINDIVQSMINVTQGNDVLSSINQSRTLTDVSGLKYQSKYTSYTEKITNTANASDFVLFGSCEPSSKPSITCTTVEYVVFYYNSNTNLYEEHVLYFGV